ncbi:LytR/AlgR family response regulator transcription factor [Pendulispora albinea]|uniref:Response regulator n=1 Tax=Pendulispora albinea TaxID=2741071 RepID=A0ABZ2LJL0_9BACT
MAGELRVLIVDDEPPARAGLRHLLAPHADVEICGECRNGAEAIDAIRRDPPGLVVLDVQMPEYDGFEVVRQVGAALMPPVLFLTAFDQFALKAFEIHAVDYVLKPCSQERFDDALARARQRIRQGELAALGQRLAHLLQDLDTVPKAALVAGLPSVTPAAPAAPASPVESQTGFAERLAIRLGNRSSIIEVRDIDWIEADDYCCSIHVGAETHVMRESLRALEGRLNPLEFVRIHRSAIVNVRRIREVHGTAGGEAMVVLHTGIQIPVSRRKRAELERRIGRPR